MAKRQTEVVAASILRTWTDSDTAMQIVGASLGVFGPGPLDPTVVLATETPLRNALFDVLLSLVEGGALEIRPSSDGRYAFRWRADIAVAGLQPNGSTAIDLEVPSPYLAELERTRAERDEALARADRAEALAAEREQLLVAEARSPAAAAVAEKPARKPAAKARPKVPRKPVVKKVAAKASEQPTLEPEERSDVLYLTPPDAVAARDVDRVAAERAATDGTESTEARSPRHRWTGYAIDKTRNRVAGIDR